MTFVVLAVLAVVLAGPAAAVLGRVTRLRHTPRAAMVLWQATALAAVLAALGATLSLVTSYGLSRGGPVSHVVAVVALALSLLVVVRLAVAGHTVGTRLRTLRRRHRQLIDAVADPGGDGTSVVPADQAMAWCLPGVRGARVVLTDAAVRRLDEQQRTAVLAHERAHLRARHDLVLEGFTVLHRAFPQVLSSGRALDEVRLLVEVLADRAARRVSGARALVGALGELTSAPPEAALGIAGSLEARLQVLLDERPRRVQSVIVLALAAALLLLPTVLVVAPWLRSLVG